MRKNRLIYISLLLLTLIFVYFYGGRPPYMLLGLMFIMPIVSFIHLLISMNTLKYSQQITVRTPMKGDKVEFAEIIVNESFIPCCYIEISYFYSKYLTGFDNLSKKYWIGPLQRIEQKQHIEFRHRGLYEFGAFEIIFTDLLGIFRVRRTLDEYIKARVVPRVHNINMADLNNNENLETQIRSKKHFEDVSLFEDVRQYQYGDSMKRVHWKLSAKNRELLVKNYSGISRNRVTLLIDLETCKGAPDDILFKEDRIIESALSIVKSFSDRFEKIQAVFFDRKNLRNIQISNPQDFLSFYDLIGLMDFKADFPATQLLKFVVTNSMSSGNVIVVSASLDLDFLGELMEVSLKGIDTSLILCDSVNSDTPEEKLIVDIKSKGVLVTDGSLLISGEGVQVYG
jgi:Uncharacterized conserved protein (some members contain a von Willebrand factor type A (vWA) domain)